MPTTVAAAGPWKGVIDTVDPTDDRPDFLTAATNGYIPDPANGSPFYQRPAVVLKNAAAKLGTVGQCIYEHVALDGTRQVFAFSDGKVYRANSNAFAAWTDVTPANVIIQTGTGTPKFIYCASLNDELVVNDGVNKPWRGTSLTSTPIVATNIEYDGQAGGWITPTATALGSASAVLAIGTTDTKVGSTAFTFQYRSGASLGTQATQTAIAAGTALAAGTIPTDTWGVYLVELDATPTMQVTAGAANFTTGYATETLAVAALPARTTTRWFVGYVTVKTKSGTTFVGGTDALKGGASGNVASQTNYWAGEGTPWNAFGPVGIYQGSAVFVLNQVGTIYARDTIEWSEPSDPSTGYQQTGFDDQWSLIQTDTAPLYGIAPTNAGLFYARSLSWGVLVGTFSVNMTNSTVSDAVSENIGTVSPASLDQFSSYVYFADAQGRPWRFGLGNEPEPIWMAMRSATEANRQDATALGQLTQTAWGIVEPNLNVYLFGFPTATSSTGYCPTTFYAFDAQTGRYAGTWQFHGGEAMETGGIVTASTGAPVLLMFGTDGGTDRGYLWQLTVPTDHTWQDQGTTMPVMAQTQRLGYSIRNQQSVPEVRVLAGQDTPCTITTVTSDGVTTMSAQAPVGVTLLSRGTTDTAVASSAFGYVVSGTGYTKAAVAAGTAFSGQTVPLNTWACYRASISAAGTITVAPAPLNTTGYATEAAALLDLPAVPLLSWDMGYLTVLTKVGSAWVAGTDALAGGTSGNPASQTNYYAGEMSFDGTYKLTFALNAITGRGVQVQVTPSRTAPAASAASQGQWVLFGVEADLVTSTSTRDQR